MAKTRKRGMRSSLSPRLNVWKFANKCRSGHGIMRFRKIASADWTKEKSNALVGVMCLVETQQQGTKFEPQTSVLGEIVGYDPETNRLIVQTYNKSGDKDGKPFAEAYSDLWALAEVTSTVHIDGTPHTVER